MLSSRIYPAGLFKYIIDHPNEVCYNDGAIVHTIPDIKSISGKIAQRALQILPTSPGAQGVMILTLGCGRM